MVGPETVLVDSTSRRPGIPTVDTRPAGATGTALPTTGLSARPAEYIIRYLYVELNS